ncbi:predicted protein [Lichtheimia corymbifera JMRC:FSU:9682]|uniref:Uncharacterized protein n=1 Tax=Lichtheimia corymbifera JMRC:FSU:9682 TaxID=1263082 RepID=A0A068RNU7_9FUNG|nr:predicted protein [Lichtheimia corymbifera JMRC:FSU:9682]
MSSPDTYGDMASMIDIDHPSTAFYHSYGDNIGDLSIVQYGPDPTDLGLLLPIRRPGALKYDPRSQVLKCNEIFLCLCATQVLEMIVRKKLNDSTQPSDATRLTDWLSDLRLEYNTISKLGIKEEHEKIKKSIKDLDQRHGSHRMKASAKRKDQEGVKCNDDQRSHKSVTTLRFIGEPNSTERRDQYNQLEAQYLSRQQRFICIHNTPSPKDIQPFTDAYAAWFMKGAAEASIYKSANAMGNDPKAVRYRGRR